MQEVKQIIDAIHSSREASQKEHSALLGKIKDIENDLHGGGFNEGLIPTVKKHSKLLKPLEIIEVYPRASLIILFITLHLTAYASFKGIDKLLELLP